MDNSIKSVLKISGYSKMIVTNLPSNIKIYSVLKAFLNPSSVFSFNSSVLIFPRVSKKDR